MPQLDPDKPKPRKKPSVDIGTAQTLQAPAPKKGAPQVINIWVANPDQKEGDGSRAQLVQAAAEVWNRALGANVVRLTTDIDQADVVINNGRLKGAKRTAIASGVVGIADKRDWDPPVIAHEIGHALGLDDSYYDVNEKGIQVKAGTGAESIATFPGIMGDTNEDITSLEAGAAWGKIAREQYGIPINDEDVSQLVAAERIKSQGKEESEPFANDVLRLFQQWSSGLYPAYADQIQAGVPPRVFLTPYTNMAERELGRAVKIDDQLIQEAASTGQMANLDAFRNYIRSTDEWDEGPAAAHLSSQLIRNLAGEA